MAPLVLQGAAFQRRTGKCRDRSARTAGVSDKIRNF